MKLLLVGAIAGLASLAAVQSPHSAQSAAEAECTGEYRWDIKTLSDDQPVNAGVADSGSLDLTVR